MKLYVVKNGEDHVVSLDALFKDPKDQLGPRAMARSKRWPKKAILEGELGMLDLEINPDGETLLASNLQKGSAIFYFYVSEDSAAQEIAAVAAYHWMGDTLKIKGGQFGGKNFV